MGLEIERKFLVHKDLWTALATSGAEKIVQAYLVNSPEKTVRVRIKGDQGFLTIKGISTGATRAEFEYSIPVKEAEELISLFSLPLISKTRTTLVYAGKTWEVDVFEGENEGLIVAEIELQSESETFDLPPWADKEVTEDINYYNSRLMTHPYTQWQTKTTKS